MRFCRRRPFSLVVVLLATSLVAHAADQPDFDALRATWIQHLENADLKASLALYSPDATFINPDGTHVTGNAMRKLFETVFASFRAKIAITARTTEVSGHLAYESGAYEETLVASATGQPRQLKGDYVTIYRRAADGTWRIAQQVWTEAPAP